MRGILWTVVSFGVLTFLVSLPAAPQETTSAPQTFVSTANTMLGARHGRTTIEFDIVNRANETVAAWRVTVRFRMSDGREEVLGLVKDSNPDSAALQSSSGLIPPNESIRQFIFVPLGVATSESINATVDFAVFADDTWVGDSAGVRDIYDIRRREEESWGLVGDAMRLGRSVGGSAGLRRALDHLNRKDQTDYTNAIKNIMRRNLQHAIDGSPLVKVQPDEFFRLWIEKADHRRKVAAGRLSPKGVRTSR